MDNNSSVVIEYSDNQADWEAFIKLLVDKFKEERSKK